MNITVYSLSAEINIKQSIGCRNNKNLCEVYRVCEKSHAKRKYNPESHQTHYWKKSSQFKQVDRLKCLSNFYITVSSLEKNFLEAGVCETTLMKMLGWTNKGLSQSAVLHIELLSTTSKLITSLNYVNSKKFKKIKKTLFMVILGRANQGY